MHISKVGNNLQVLAVLAISLAIRLINVGMPILEGTIVRQVQTASISRFFYHNGIDILRSRMDHLCGNAGYLVLEFPLYNIILSFLYKLSGGVHEYLGRILSISFFLGSAFFLYLIVKKIYDHRTALIALIVYNLSPLGIIFSRAIMPDSEMLFFCTSAVFFLLCFADSGKRWCFWASALLGMAALLVKIQSFHIVVPLFFIIFYRQRYKCFADYRNYVFLAIVAVPAMLWYLNAATVYKTISPGRDTLFVMANWFDFSRFFSPDMYADLIRVWTGTLLTAVGFVLCLVGLAVKPQKKIETVCFAWFLGALLYLAVFNALLWEDYYYLPVLPVASLFIARVFLLDWTNVIKKTYLSAKTGIIVCLAIAALMIGRYSSYAYIIPAEHRDIPEIADAVKHAVKDDETVIVNPCHESNGVLYYSGHRGWMLDLAAGSEPDKLRDFEDGIKKFAAEGARYFLIIERDSDPDIIAGTYHYLDGKYKLIEQKANKYRIYALK